MKKNYRPYFTVLIYITVSCLLCGCSTHTFTPSPDQTITEDFPTEATIPESMEPEHSDEIAIEAPEVSESESVTVPIISATAALNTLVKDSGMRERIASALYISEEHTEADLQAKIAECTFLSLAEGRCENLLSSLEDLTVFPNLKGLEIHINSWDDSRIDDFTPLTRLSSLEQLYISYDLEGEVVDYSFLADMTQLKKLSLPDCYITDFSFLEKMPQLEKLSLYGTEVADASFLRFLPNLKELNLAYCNVTANISTVSLLTHLEDLDLSNCNINDIDFLKELTHLKYLSLNDNFISDLTPLQNLTDLEILFASSNQIREISVLSGLPHLTDVGLSWNQVNDLSPLTNHENLIYVSARNNPIQGLAPVWGTPQLYFGNFGGDTELSSMQTDLLSHWVSVLYPDMEDYRCFDYITGDINDDGYTDTAFVIDELISYEEDEERFPETRYLILLLQNANGSYEAIADTPELMDAGAGGTRGEPYGGMIMEKGYLTIRESWGSSTGGSTVTRYKFENNSLVPLEYHTTNDCNFSFGEGYTIEYVAGEWKRYALAWNGRTFEKLFLYDSNTPWHKAFPMIDLYWVSYEVHESPIPTNLTAAEALDLYLGKVDYNVVQEALPYDAVQKESMDIIKGTVLPDYYYTVPSEALENYCYYSDLTYYDGEWMHLITHHTPNGEYDYFVSDKTGKITATNLY